MAGGTNAQMLEWGGEYEKLAKELNTATATRATTTEEATAKEAPATTTEASRKKARKVTFKEPSDYGKPRKP